MNRLKTFLPHFAATLVVGCLAMIGGFYLAAENSVQASPGLSNTMATANALDTPGQINYQGSLRDLDGNLINGTHDLTFHIYDGPTEGATSLWTETHIGETVRNGHFSILLGDVETMPESTFDGPERYIGVTIDSFDELIPRQRFASVPYAIIAKKADNGVPAGAIMHFRLNTCPDGWKAAPDLNGRYVVGAATSIGETVGTALDNKQNRSVGRHTHTAIDSGHTHGITDKPHAHGVTDPGHSHTFQIHDETGTARHARYSDSDLSGTISTSSNTTGISIQSSFAGINSTNLAAASITVNEEGNVAGTNAPYIQLLACEKE